jgi:prophage tail gpP-like protein
MDLRIELNGSTIFGLLHASIVTSNCFSADSFALTFVMGPPPMGDIMFWSSLSSAYVEIHAAAAYEPVSERLISGMIDAVQVNPTQGTVAIEGRDLSSTMIDAYRQQDFVNQTASEVVSIIAQYHGLAPVVSATSGNVGRYFGDGYTRLSLGQFSRLRSDWDVVVQLARENMFDVFVQGTTLYFQPSVASSSVPVHLALRDLKLINFQRSLNITSSTTARVQSWNSQSVASYDSGSPPSSGAGAPASSGTTAQPFLFSASNLTSQQVTNTAERYSRELSRLGTVLHAEMPWNLALSARTIIFLDETAPAFDTLYQIESIERHYNTTSGSTQIIRAVVV